MKKRILNFVMACAVMLPCAFAFAACNDTGPMLTVEFEEGSTGAWNYDSTTSKQYANTYYVTQGNDEVALIVFEQGNNRGATFSKGDNDENYLAFAIYTKEPTTTLSVKANGAALEQVESGDMPTGMTAPSTTDYPNVYYYKTENYDENVTLSISGLVQSTE